MSEKIFEEYVGSRVVVVYEEEGESKSLVGLLEKYEKPFLVVSDDYGNDVLINSNTIQKLKIKGGEDNGHNSPQ